eukprot:SAG31_NODE_1657_length_7619_cov_10.364362_3_plen_80_part_00
MGNGFLKINLLLNSVLSCFGTGSDTETPGVLDLLLNLVPAGAYTDVPVRPYAGCRNFLELYLVYSPPGACEGYMYSRSY